MYPQESRSVVDANPLRSRVTHTSATSPPEADPTSENTPLLQENRTEEEPLVPGRENEEEHWPGRHDFAGLPWWRRPSIYWILPSFLLAALAFSGILVPKINLILHLICNDLQSEGGTSSANFTKLPVLFGIDESGCRTAVVQSHVARFNLYASFLSGIFAAVTGPKLGALSDRYGRKPIIITATIGLIAGEAVTVIAATYPETVSVNWILLGYALDGITGSFMSSMAMVHAYACDCLPPSERSVAFGWFHGCLYAGIALGPIAAAQVINLTHSITSVFYVALGGHIFFLLFIWLCVPESLTKTRQLAAREQHRLKRLANRPQNMWKKTVQFFNFVEPLNVLYPKGEGVSTDLRRNLALLASVDTMIFGIAMASISVFIIYTNYRFGWEIQEASVLISLVNTCRVGCLFLVIPLITRLVKGPKSKRSIHSYGADNFELSLIRASIVFDIIGYAGYSMATTGTLFLASGVIGSLGSIGSPLLQAVLTKHVPRNQTGQLLGATGLLHALARVAGPTVISGLYSVTVGKFTPAVFICLTCSFGLALVVSFFIKPHVSVQDPAPPVVVDEPTDVEITA